MLFLDSGNENKSPTWTNDVKTALSTSLRSTPKILSRTCCIMNSWLVNNAF